MWRTDRLQCILYSFKQVEPSLQVRRSVLASPDAPAAPPADTAGSFAAFAARQKLSPALAALAAHAILQLPTALDGGGDGGPTATDGVRGVCRHMRSLGVYGPTAYLACLYGSSELPPNRFGI